LLKELRGYLAVFCTGAFLFCSVSAAGISLQEALSGGFQDSGISIPALPPPESGSALQRKLLDSQPQIYKDSDRLLKETEISRDTANKKIRDIFIISSEGYGQRGKTSIDRGDLEIPSERPAVGV